MITGTKMEYNPTVSEQEYNLIAKIIYPVSSNPLNHKKMNNQDLNIKIKKLHHISRQSQYYMKHTRFNIL